MSDDPFAAPQSTYDAVVWSLIYNKQPTPQMRADNLRRLAELSPRQFHELIAALKRKNCDPELIAGIEGAQ